MTEPEDNGNRPRSQSAPVATDGQEADPAGTRPRAQTAPAVTGNEPKDKDKFKTSASISDKLHERDWVNLSDAAKTKALSLGGPTTLQGVAAGSVKVTTEATAGIGSDGLKAEASITAKINGDVSAKLESRIAQRDVKGQAQLGAAASAAASAAAKLGTAGLSLEGKAEAEAKATAKTELSGNIDDRHSASAGGEAVAYATATASASAQASLAKGLGAEGKLEAGVGAKLGPTFVLKQGNNSYTSKPRLVLGKVGGGAKVGITNEVGKIGFQAKLGANIGVGLEGELKIDYDTEQIAAAGRHASSRMKERLGAILARPLGTEEQRFDRFREVAEGGSEVIGDFADKLKEEGRRQGGVVGTGHVIAGTLLELGAGSSRFVNKGAAEAAIAVYKAGDKAVDVGKQAWGSVKALFSF
ncbi:hypothetical protein [Nitrospirillum viridazoti]|uniref:Uncharacterized protein n=1 Tax=Nitrospirillum amazonense TaxID=28077 RepID=A0A560J0X2_9PROT|nr:hypothetical protein [Nitrospirillum amazonense]TWB64415.1 hypothetical protein FBZ92_101311 [Nitrospirillum amazonense]